MIKLKDLLSEDKYPKNKFFTITSSNELQQLADNLYDLVMTSYSSIGGHPSVRSSSDVNSSGINTWVVADVDNDPEIDVTAFAKKRAGGSKFVGIGHDGEKPNIKKLLTKMTTLLKKKGNYMEVSGDAFRTFAVRGNVPIIEDEKLVRKVLKGKGITWYGKHPKKDLPGNGWYGRNIEGLGVSIKTLIGNPSV